MMFRNLMAMDVEEMIRAQPMDAVVLIGGCDKTVPAQLMGAVSAGRPAISARHRADAHRPPSRRAHRRLHRLPAVLGAASRRRNRRGGHRRGRGAARGHGRHLQRDGHGEHDGVPRRSARHVAARHRGDSRGPCRAPRRGRRDRPHGGGAGGDRLTPDRIVTAGAVDNALRLLLALGGSTNALIHLTAIAGRLGHRRSTSIG